MKIAVCIPGHWPHRQYLQSCLDSIFAQTRLPDIISVSMSGVPTDAPPLHYDSPVPLRIHTSPHPACAGANRNRAAAAAIAAMGDVDVISFFDIDDCMHRDRLRLLEKAFADISGANMFVHQCSDGFKDHPVSTDLLTQRPQELFFTNCFYTYRDGICGRVHVVREAMPFPIRGHCNGWLSLRTSLWKEQGVPEGYGEGEDSEYLWRLYNRYPKSLVFCTDQLGMYRR